MGSPVVELMVSPPLLRAIKGGLQEEGVRGDGALIVDEGVLDNPGRHGMATLARGEGLGFWKGA